MRAVPFTPFTDKDFDAYLQPKWQSNVFNRERLEVKQKLQGLGRALAGDLQAADGSLLECEVSAEHPALWNKKQVRDQHLFFSRNKDARSELDGLISKKRTMASLIEDPSPLRNHIFLSVKIDQRGVELGLKLHSDAAVDRDNLSRMCQEFFTREKLLGLLNGLPGDYQVGIIGDPAGATPAPELDDERLQALVETLPGANSWLAVWHDLPREDPRSRSEELVQLTRQRLTQLLPALHFIAWSRDNDYVSIRDTLKEREVKRQSKGLRKDDTVRVVQGIFAGKRGVVQEVEAKGKLKVRVGGLLLKLNSQDVDKV
jgi:transcription antitermination factor NusG